MTCHSEGGVRSQDLWRNKWLYHIHSLNISVSESIYLPINALQLFVCHHGDGKWGHYRRQLHVTCFTPPHKNGNCTAERELLIILLKYSYFYMVIFHMVIFIYKRYTAGNISTQGSIFYINTNYLICVFE
jgi:hypothetical protein